MRWVVPGGAALLVGSIALALPASRQLLWDVITAVLVGGNATRTGDDNDQAGRPGPEAPGPGSPGTTSERSTSVSTAPEAATPPAAGGEVPSILSRPPGSQPDWHPAGKALINESGQPATAFYDLRRMKPADRIEAGEIRPPLPMEGVQEADIGGVTWYRYKIDENTTVYVPAEAVRAPR